ncbi:MAG: hypothetical protein A3B09_00870 [Candidatus Taylorbacteria bacterium RIFCSPLOWO2_01_FULL_43_83]|nr:MAG: hypothetical protein A3B09_00870 [Candidatus Taylorbacteria bacterium RIFCSPLOWO2_01_FULL_43_83]
MDYNFVFFGNPKASVSVLESMRTEGMSPSLVVSGQDMPKGRGMRMYPSDVKAWAMANKISHIEPSGFNDPVFVSHVLSKKWNFFLVAAYGKILPKSILEAPEKGAINVHFSLLPKHRGATPLESSILSGDKETGVSIILMDEQMDHGPVLAQEKYVMPDPLLSAGKLGDEIGKIAGKLLLKTLPDFLSGKIKPDPQDDTRATYCGKFDKKAAEIDLRGDQISNWRKIKAFEDTLKPHFYAEKNDKRLRVIIKDADFISGRLIIKRVVPESGKEISFEEFKKQFTNFS